MKAYVTLGVIHRAKRDNNVTAGCYSFIGQKRDEKRKLIFFFHLSSVRYWK
jgi:hypothetical protein